MHAAEPYPRPQLLEKRGIPLINNARTGGWPLYLIRIEVLFSESILGQAMLAESLDLRM
jgi:hypothetical protein